MKVNDKLIADFERFCVAENLGARRVLKYRYTMRTLSRMLNKPFKQATKKDIEDLIIKINKSAYSEWTKKDFKIAIRKFYRWLNQSKKVDWIKATMKNKPLIRPEDVLTEEEVYQMVDSATTPRDKAFISMMYESGARIGEMIGLKLGDITFDDMGYYFVCNGKTGDVPKRVMNDKAIRLLNIWLENHPHKDNESNLWISFSSNKRFESMGEAGFRKMLKDIAGRMGITKRVNPHAFRHARITNLLFDKKVPESVVKLMMGHRPSSNMFDVYSHGKFSDIDNALKKIYGKGKQKQKENMVNELGKMLANDSSFRTQIAKMLVGARKNG